ncbi:MAG: hypothetical protein R2838_21605 [Caldilineaceae bacterium]
MRRPDWWPSLGTWKTSAGLGWSVETLKIDQLAAPSTASPTTICCRPLPGRTGCPCHGGHNCAWHWREQVAPQQRFEILLSRILAAEAKLCNRMALYPEALAVAREAILLAAASAEAGAEAEGYLQAALALRYQATSPRRWTVPNRRADAGATA